MAGQAYDYVITGAGPAGCVLATRLSEDPKVKVLLLEAGPEDKDPYIHWPVGFYKMTSGTRNSWGYETVPLAHLDGRRMWYPQGRVLGGGGSINAQVFTRGHAKDYDAWAEEEGCTGWSLPGDPALLPARRGQRALQQRLARHRRPARRVRPDFSARDVQDLRARGAGGGPALQSGLQRRAPGGLRPLPGEPAQRPAVQRCRGLPAPGNGAAQPRPCAPTRRRPAS